jgi:hypothetical protein
MSLYFQVSTAMGNLKKKATTGEKTRNALAKKLQAKKSQAASHTYKRKCVKDKDEDGKETSSFKVGHRTAL